MVPMEFAKQSRGQKKYIAKISHKGQVNCVYEQSIVLYHRVV